MAIADRSEWQGLSGHPHGFVSVSGGIVKLSEIDPAIDYGDLERSHAVTEECGEAMRGPRLECGGCFPCALVYEMGEEGPGRPGRDIPGVSLRRKDRVGDF